MTPDEAKAVLVAAGESAQFQQWQDVDHLLRHVYDKQLLTGTDQGDAAYLLGLAYLNTAALDAAAGMLTEASTTASTAKRAEAKQHLAELARHDTAVDAEVDGVDQKESTAVLAAGEDALGRGDLDEAYTHYWAAYDGQADIGPRAKAALGIARVWAHRGDLTQATQYAEYVVGTGQAGPAAEAKTLLEWIKDQQGATAAIADGTTADEYATLSTTARSAFFAGDYERALPVLESIIAAPQLGSTEHAKAALNAGLAEMMLGRTAEARAHFEFAAAHGPAATVQKAQTRLASMDSHEKAEQLVAEFED
jgi:tetratricopeptide (TPR) repeat protein